MSAAEKHPDKAANPRVTAPGSPDVVLPAESTFLDLDGDGIPDAVQTRQTVGYDTTQDGVANVVETTEEVASGIDMNGVPHRIEVTQTIEADVDHDGELDIIDIAKITAEPSKPSSRPSLTLRRMKRGLAVAARPRNPLLRREAQPGFALVRLRPTELLDSLETVTRNSSPEGDVRVSIDQDLVGLAVHSPPANWWAGTAIAAKLRRGSPVAVTVDRALLRDALAGAVASHPRGIPMAVRLGEGLSVGHHAVPAVLEKDRRVAPPPHFERWRQIEHEVVVPTAREEAGETTFPFNRGTVTTTNGLLRAFEVWAITRVAVFEAAGRAFLLGSSDERRAVNRVVVTGEARVHYS